MYRRHYVNSAEQHGVKVVISCTFSPAREPRKVNKLRIRLSAQRPRNVVKYAFRNAAERRGGLSGDIIYLSPQPRELRKVNELRTRITTFR
jgi:hypothetical protein